MSSTVVSAEEINREWLSGALGFEVRSAAVEPIGTGQTSSTYRLSIDAEDCARTLIAKFAEGPRTHGGGWLRATETRSAFTNN